MNNRWRQVRKENMRTTRRNKKCIETVLIAGVGKILMSQFGIMAILTEEEFVIEEHKLNKRFGLSF